MARTSKGPWYWKERKEWVVNVRGKRHYLGPNKTAAINEWHKLQSTPRTKKVSGYLVGLLDNFLSYVEKNKPDSFSWYAQRINDFATHVPDLQTAELLPHHLQEWIDTKKSNGHKRGCAVAVIRALNWAEKQGYIEKTPLRGFEKPPAGQRETVITLKQYEHILSIVKDQAFRELLTFLWETGCRPQEVSRLEARHVDLENNRCVFPKNESKGKKKQRVIYLTPISEEIVRRLVKEHPNSTLFRNARGEEWKRNNAACRFARMKPKIGMKLCLYDFRHSFVTRLLKAGVDPITIGHLAGHADVSMIARVYANIQNDTEHLKAALAKGSAERTSVV
ncbi:MAG: tyrosine-type recombinase/integrase [Planctomycetaceae bacterium]